jgi:hypothetical protein
MYVGIYPNTHPGKPICLIWTIIVGTPRHRFRILDHGQSTADKIPQEELEGSYFMSSESSKLWERNVQLGISGPNVGMKSNE